MVNLSRQPLHIINVQFILRTDSHEFELRVTATFSSFKQPIGATRRFAVSADNDPVSLTPKSPMTDQLISFRQRRRVYRRLKDTQTFETG